MGGRTEELKQKHTVSFGDLNFAFNMLILSHLQFLNRYFHGWYRGYTFTNLGKQILKQSYVQSLFQAGHPIKVPCRKPWTPLPAGNQGFAGVVQTTWLS